jgi:hypothetical protein
VPFFFSCMALFTFFWAPFEYFAIIKFYVCYINYYANRSYEAENFVA